MGFENGADHSQVNINELIVLGVEETTEGLAVGFGSYLLGTHIGVHQIIEAFDNLREEVVLCRPLDCLIGWKSQERAWIVSEDLVECFD